MRYSNGAAELYNPLSNITFTGNGGTNHTHLAWQCSNGGVCPARHQRSTGANSQQQCPQLALTGQFIIL
jgi:hypothetical protein